MGKRDNNRPIAAAPATTHLWKLKAVDNGNDGDVSFTIAIISCASSSAVPMQYRVDRSIGFSPDPDGEWATLAAGETRVLRLNSNVDKSTVGYQAIKARGVGGVATGGLEVLQP